MIVVFLNLVAIIEKSISSRLLIEISNLKRETHYSYYSLTEKSRKREKKDDNDPAYIDPSSPPHRAVQLQVAASRDPIRHGVPHMERDHLRLATDPIFF